MRKKVKAPLLWIAKRNKLARNGMLKTKFFFQNLKYSRITKKTTVDEKTCIFESFNGRSYSDNPKALYLEMLQNKKFDNYNFIWCFKKPDKYKFLEKNKNTKIVKYNSMEYKKAYAKAKYWFTCSRLINYLKPKKNQVYVQCWHGTPLKRLGADIKVDGQHVLNDTKVWTKKHVLDAERYSYLVSPSKFTTEKLKSAFKIKDTVNIIELGYPRNDSLFKYNLEDIEKIKEKLSLPKDKKIILYAPTWRDNQHKSSIGYIYNLAINFDDLYEKFSDEYIILFRTHYLISNKIDLKKYSGFIYNVSTYQDINDLFIISDMILTDYSSVFVDYANLKRPMLFFMYDFDDYKNKMRDFYMDLDELPGPISKTQEELYFYIKNPDEYWKEYEEKYNRFNKKYNYLDGKDTSRKVLDKIFFDAS